ncbi:MAG: ABC transporter substrate-binding protein [Deltaproteobacteria bacterium]|nr:ABC transporter substrate-binding protein [Deltaproteobacteria bacterium]
MHNQETKNITLGDLVAAVTDEVGPSTGNTSKVNTLVSYIVQDLFLHCRVRFKNRRGRMNMILPMQQKWPAVTLGVLLLMSPGSGFAGAAADQLKQSVEKIQAILSDPSLKGDAKTSVRRQKLKQVVAARFDFDEMAKRSLGAQWQKRSDSEKKEFVRLFTDLLEGTYLSRLEEYSGEKVRFVNEREDKDFAEVNTKVINKNGDEFALDYRLIRTNGDWKVSDVVIENISLVNNYRSQFNRVLSKSSFEELVQAMKQKKLSAPGAAG